MHLTPPPQRAARRHPDGPGTRATQLRRVCAVALAALVAVVTATVQPAAAQSGDPTVSPATVLSADGRTATDGVRTLTVSQVRGLSPAGQTIRVTGRGYDTNKGVYVALCVIPPRNVVPSPCGGGVDLEGQAGASQWFSSNPPSYGVGLAKPYGPGGSFDTTFRVSPVISPTVDCRQVRCAVVTRNDHSRSSDRSQDILVPVTFAAGAAAPPAAGGGGGAPAPAPSAPQSTAPQSTAPPTTAPTTTAPPTTTTTTTPPAPEATLSPDGREVSDGTRTLRASRVDGLDPTGERIRVAGDGFDERRGIYVALCRTNGATAHGATDHGGSDGGGAAPGPCATGEGHAAWISSAPPEWGAELAQPFAPGGRFEVELELVAKIDGATDCTAEGVECAVVVRADDTAAHDRSLDLALPVRFAPEPPERDEPAAADEDADVAADVAPAAAGEEHGTGGSGGLAVLVVALAAVVAAGGGGLWWRARRRPARSGAPLEAPPAERPGWSG